MGNKFKEKNHKLLYVSGSYPDSPEGIADAAKLLLDTMAENNTPDNMVLLTTDTQIVSNNIDTNTKLKYYLMPDWRVKPSNVRKFFDIVEENNITEIHMEYPGDLYGKTFLASFLPLIVRIHNLFSANKLRFYVRLHEFSRARFLRKVAIIPIVLFAHAVYIPSLHDRNVVRKIAGKKVKSTLIGTNISTVKTICEKEKNDKVCISYFGSVYPGKGIEQMIDLWKDIKKKDTDNQIEFKIIGDIGTEKENHFAEYHKSVWEKIMASGIDGCIKVTGYVSDEQASIEMAESDIATLMYEDGLTLRRGSFIAFLAHGVPIITTAMDEEAKEVLSDLDGVYAQNDQSKMIEKIYEWIGSEESAMKKMYQQNIDKAEYFSWHDIALKFLKDYELTD